MRIAHISDIHIARPLTRDECNAKRLLGSANHCMFRKRRYAETAAQAALTILLEQAPDLVLLTGDLTQHGLPGEFDAARELLSPIVRLRIPLLAVPGNHDVYGGTENPALRALLRELAGGLAPDGDGVFRLGEVEILPLFQGIRTPLFCSHGRQNPQELAAADTAWRSPPEGVMRLAMGHYPLIGPGGRRLSRFRGLREGERLEQFCADRRVAGYFCGHLHGRFVTPMEGGGIQFAAPALSALKRPAEERVSVYLCGGGREYPVEVFGG